MQESQALKKTNDLRVYAVNNAGDVIETSGFDGLTANIKSVDAEKIYVGPALPEQTPASKINERTLINIGAYQTVKNISNDNILNIQRLPDSISLFPKNFIFAMLPATLIKILRSTDKLKTCPFVMHVYMFVMLKEYFTGQFMLSQYFEFRIGC